MFGNCAATATSNIHGIPGGEGTIYIPNAFTPNGDHLNEFFLAKGEGIVSFSMNIFDRWGNLLFVSDDVNKGWNGKIEGGHYMLKGDGDDTSQQDVYIWKISYATECYPKRSKNLIGHVSIVK
jgi:gliding motility-associated-like protein